MTLSEACVYASLLWVFEATLRAAQGCGPIVAAVCRRAPGVQGNRGAEENVIRKEAGSLGREEGSALAV